MKYFRKGGKATRANGLGSPFPPQYCKTGGGAFFCTKVTVVCV